MTDQLDALPESARAAVRTMDDKNTVNGCWNTCRDELLRLTGDCNAERLRADTYTAKYEVMRERAEKAEARVQELERENGELRGRPILKTEWQELTERAERAEAELVAVKKRIAEAPRGIVFLDEREVPSISCDFDEGTHVALLPLDDEAKS